jgi:carbon storage regulator
MLVLTRKASQSIVIEGGITITVVGVKGNQVRLGISAPPNVSINREEILRRVQAWAEPDPAERGQRADGLAV